MKNAFLMRLARAYKHWVSPRQMWAKMTWKGRAAYLLGMLFDAIPAFPAIAIFIYCLPEAILLCLGVYLFCQIGYGERLACRLFGWRNGLEIRKGALK